MLGGWVTNTQKMPIVRDSCVRRGSIVHYITTKRHERVQDGAITPGADRFLRTYADRLAREPGGLGHPEGPLQG